MADDDRLASMPEQWVEDRYRAALVFSDRVLDYLNVLGELLSSLEFPRQYPPPPKKPPGLDQLLQEMRGDPIHRVDTHMDDWDRVLTPRYHGARRRWLHYEIHFAASAALLREHSWVHGTITSTHENNFLSAMASLRGVVEASADVYYALKKAPSVLVAWDRILRIAVDGAPVREGPQAVESFMAEAESVIMDVAQLLDGVRHFRYALGKIRTRRSEYSHAPAAETMRSYIDSFDDCSDPVHDLYSLLCEYTHPSGLSFIPFVAPAEDGIYITPLDAHPLVTDVCRDHDEAIQIVLERSIGSCLLSLKTLNMLAGGELDTPVADAVDLAVSPRWETTWSHLKSTIDQVHSDFPDPPPFDALPT